jgi:hypothetical protein
MAQKTRQIKLTWENGVNFTMTSKLGDESWKIIINIDEDGHLDKLWDVGIAPICTKYFETELNIIGGEMKA